jgi:hypothetical protein
VKRLLAAMTVLCLLSLAVPALAGGGPIKNGSFEKGSLRGWKVDQGNNGKWLVYSGTKNLCGGPAEPPAGGTYAAATDQGDPGVHILYQDIAIPQMADGAVISLVLTLAYDSGSAFFPQKNFDVSHPKTNPNQQFRIDLMKPSAPLKSLDKNDIRATVFKTQSADLTSLGWTPVGLDVTSFQGKTVRLRLVEADNQGCLTAMIDDVGLTAII